MCFQPVILKNVCIAQGNNGWDILARGLQVVLRHQSGTLLEEYRLSRLRIPRIVLEEVIHLAGFTDRQLKPEEAEKLLDFRCGVTKLVDKPTVQATEVVHMNYVAADASLIEKMRTISPRRWRCLCKQAFERGFGSAVSHGVNKRSPLARRW